MHAWSVIASLREPAAPARFEAVRRPLHLPATAPRRRRLGRRWLALAAGLVIVAGAATFWSWRWSWPTGAPWPVTLQSAAPGAAEKSVRLQLNGRFELPPVKSWWLNWRDALPGRVDRAR